MEYLVVAGKFIVILIVIGLVLTILKVLLDQRNDRIARRFNGVLDDFTTKRTAHNHLTTERAFEIIDNMSFQKYLSAKHNMAIKPEDNRRAAREALIKVINAINFLLENGQAFNDLGSGTRLANAFQQCQDLKMSFGITDVPLFKIK